MYHALNFVIRVAKINSNKGYGLRKEEQQDIVNYAEKTMLEQRILEFDYDISEVSDSDPKGIDEKVKKVSEKG